MRIYSHFLSLIHEKMFISKYEGESLLSHRLIHLGEGLFLTEQTHQILPIFWYYIIEYACYPLITLILYEPDFPGHFSLLIPNIL